MIKAYQTHAIFPTREPDAIFVGAAMGNSSKNEIGCGGLILDKATYQSLREKLDSAFNAYMDALDQILKTHNTTTKESI
ncbi:MAG: hypothetical protein J5651_00300 [Salinivirgaceae bacterium]|nr:hypothetical protein [Salinivirgaceae bacterium]